MAPFSLKEAIMPRGMRKIMGAPMIVDNMPHLDEGEGEQIKYSGGKDYNIGQPRQNGIVTGDGENSFSTEDKAKTGLTCRKPL